MARWDVTIEDGAPDQTSQKINLDKRPFRNKCRNHRVGCNNIRRGQTIAAVGSGVRLLFPHNVRRIPGLTGCVFLAPFYRDVPTGYARTLAANSDFSTRPFWQNDQVLVRAVAA